MGRNTFTGSVTAAWSGRVLMGSFTPAMSAIKLAQPAVQLTTVGVEMRPRLVTTPVTFPPGPFPSGPSPPVTSMSVTSVCWCISIPMWSAARA